MKIIQIKLRNGTVVPAENFSFTEYRSCPTKDMDTTCENNWKRNVDRAHSINFSFRVDDMPVPHEDMKTVEEITIELNDEVLILSDPIGWGFNNFLRNSYNYTFFFEDIT